MPFESDTIAVITGYYLLAYLEVIFLNRVSSKAVCVYIVPHCITSANYHTALAGSIT